MGYPLGIY